MSTRSRSSAIATSSSISAARHRGRLLDEDVLPGLERLLRELVVGRNRRRDDDGVELGVGEHLLEAVRPARLRVPRLELLVLPVGRVAEPGELGEVGEVPREVLPPLAQAGLADADGHSFQTLSERRPFAPVAFRRSTTSTRLVDERAVVDPGVVRHDDDAVVLRRLER